MLIRFFREQDYNPLSVLLNTVYKNDGDAPPMTPERLRDEFRNRGENPTELSVVLESSDSETVGFCGYNPLSGGRALLDGPVVRQDYRRQGWGQRLFEEVAGTLRERGIQTVSVVVGEGNLEAIGFLKNLGFHEEKTDLIVVCERPVSQETPPPEGVHVEQTNGNLNTAEYLDLHSRLFESRGLEFLGMLARSPNYSIYTACEDEQLVGFLELEYLEEVATIEAFGVAPEARRRGIGRALLTRALKDAWSQPAVRKVRQIWNSPEENSVRLYLELGFVEKYSICGMVRELGPAPTR